MNEQRNLEHVGEVLDGLLGRLGLGHLADLARMKEDWDRMAGDPWARRSRPGVLEHGRLSVIVDDGATASLLRYRIPELLERLNQELGTDRVTAVAIKVERPGGRTP